MTDDVKQKTGNKEQSVKIKIEEDPQLFDDFDLFSMFPLTRKLG
jgi:hypothetical protein